MTLELIVLLPFGNDATSRHESESKAICSIQKIGNHEAFILPTTAPLYKAPQSIPTPLNSTRSCRPYQKNIYTAQKRVKAFPCTPRAFKASLPASSCSNFLAAPADLQTPTPPHLACRSRRPCTPRRGQPTSTACRRGGGRGSGRFGLRRTLARVISPCFHNWQ